MFDSRDYIELWHDLRYGYHLVVCTISVGGAEHNEDFRRCWQEIISLFGIFGPFK